MFAWFTSSMVRGRGRDRTSNEAFGAPRGAGIEARVAALLARNWVARLGGFVSVGTSPRPDARDRVPRVLIMDEPFAGLDRESVRTVWDVFLRSRSERLGTIVVDHNVDLLRDIFALDVLAGGGARGRRGSCRARRAGGRSESRGCQRSAPVATSVYIGDRASAVLPCRPGRSSG